MTTLHERFLTFIITSGIALAMLIVIMTLVLALGLL